jgi:2-polyprenyl-3-methyl-5-hydroxy-6-metoxy-1,4-benzoquinol methylase
MENNSWKSYVEQTKEKPPRPLLVEALQYVKIKNNALDVGSGSLNDSRFLIREGFAFVNAIDQAPVAQEISTSLPKDKFRYIISKIEDIELFPETYDLITAQFSLPFISPDSFEVTFAKLLSSLK